MSLGVIHKAHNHMSSLVCVTLVIDMSHTFYQVWLQTVSWDIALFLVFIRDASLIIIRRKSPETPHAIFW